MIAFVRTEFCLFLSAVQFLTRLPVPGLFAFDHAWLDRSVKYFPLAGVVVGGISAAVLLAASLVWTGPLPALLAVAAGVAATGAFHEDGFADFFDAMGGSTKEKRLAIMTDSRLGTFGVVATVLNLGVKVFALAALPVTVAAAALIAIHAGGRLAVIATMPVLPYAKPVEAGKMKPAGQSVTARGLAVASVFGLAPLALLPLPLALAGLAAGVAAVLFMGWRAKRLIGGYTGDVLGAFEQSFELAFLLALAACV
jgi:adenosylcobinamide-GDP ribazoletransferase